MLLIVINILVFLYEFSLRLDPYSRNAFIGALRPAAGLFPRSANLFTSMFLHGGWMHVLGNMWFLWIFGDNIEDILGHGKYLVFYLLCGVAAALAQVLINPSSRVPMVGAQRRHCGRDGRVPGEVSALATSVTAHAGFFFIFTFDMPAWVMLIYWFAIQLFSGVGSVARHSVRRAGHGVLRARGRLRRGDRR